MIANIDEDQEVAFNDSKDENDEIDDNFYDENKNID